MNKKLLVPLDGSELAEHAIPWARLLSEKMQLEVELLRCYEPLASVYMLPEFAPPPVFFDQSAIHAEIDRYLERQSQSFPHGMASALTCEGDPSAAILTRTESGEVAMVVMASHGRGGLGRWLLGSVATKVLRGSQVPVLVFNNTTEVPGTPDLKSILVPLDGSETSEEALPKAIELAAAFNAEVVLYQAVEHTPIGHPKLDAAVAYETANAKEYLEMVKGRYPQSRVRTKVKTAGPGLGIVEQAEKHDLVVMCSHGRSGVRRWLLGSVAENVLQRAHKPLLIVYAQHPKE